MSKSLSLSLSPPVFSYSTVVVVVFICLAVFFFFPPTPCILSTLSTNIFKLLAKRLIQFMNSQSRSLIYCSHVTLCLRGLGKMMLDELGKAEVLAVGKACTAIF